MSAASVFLAYQSRFDFAVPRSYAPGMWFWMAVVALLRPISVAIFTGYRTVWRFLRVQDLTVLLVASVPASLLLLILRLSAEHSSVMADIPLGVIALEFAVFASIGHLRAWPSASRL